MGNFKDILNTVVIFLLFVVISSFLVYGGFSNNSLERIDNIKDDVANIQEDFEIQDFVLGSSAIFISRYFPNDYNLYWWEEYIAENEGIEVYNNFYFEENPRFTTLRIMYFDFGYKRNYQELPEDIYFIFMHEDLPDEDFNLLKCYNLLCVYEK